MNFNEDVDINRLDELEEAKIAARANFLYSTTEKQVATISKDNRINTVQPKIILTRNVYL